MTLELLVGKSFKFLRMQRSHSWMNFLTSFLSPWKGVSFFKWVLASLVSAGVVIVRVCNAPSRSSMISSCYSRVLPFVNVKFSFSFSFGVEGSSFYQIGSSVCQFIWYQGAKGLPCSQCCSLVQVRDQRSGSLAEQRQTQIDQLVLLLRLQVVYHLEHR